jgi:hypothetical protein
VVTYAEWLRDDNLRGGAVMPRYRVLHEDDRRLINGWFERAPDRRGCGRSWRCARHSRGT